MDLFYYWEDDTYFPDDWESWFHLSDENVRDTLENNKHGSKLLLIWVSQSTNNDFLQM